MNLCKYSTPSFQLKRIVFCGLELLNFTTYFDKLKQTQICCIYIYVAVECPTTIAHPYLWLLLSSGLAINFLNFIRLLGAVVAKTVTANVFTLLTFEYMKLFCLAISGLNLRYSTTFLSQINVNFSAFSYMQFLSF